MRHGHGLTRELQAPEAQNRVLRNVGSMLWSGRPFSEQGVEVQDKVGNLSSRKYIKNIEESNTGEEK